MYCEEITLHEEVITLLGNISDMRNAKAETVGLAVACPTDWISDTQF